MRLGRGIHLGVLLLLLGSCRQAAPVAPGSSPAPRLRIVATFAPIYCFTRNIVGDLADVEMLVPEKGGVEGYTVSPADKKRLAGADVIIENGFGFEPWLDALIPGILKPGAVRIVAARGVAPLFNLAPSGAPPKPNPYVWLDPLRAIKEVQNIRDGLMARDPVHEEEFLINENRFETSLRDLDDDVGRAIVGLSGREVECLSETFEYFCIRYELDTSYESRPLLATGNALPAEWIKGVLFSDKLHHTKAFLAAPGDLRFFPGISNAVGLPLVILDPMESGPASADYYENVTRANVATFCRELK